MHQKKIMYILTVLLPFFLLGGTNNLYAGQDHSTVRDLAWLTRTYSRHCSVKGNRIIIKREIDLLDCCLTLPDNSELYFKRKGSIHGGSIVCNHLLLSGNPRIGSQINGSIDNESIKASWLLFSNPISISSFVTALFNQEKAIPLILDKDIALDGSEKEVRHVIFLGDGHHKIKNSCIYSMLGNVTLKDCHISIQSPAVHLFNFDRCSQNNIRIDVENCAFEAYHNIDRLFHSGIYQKKKGDYIKISNSTFSGFNHFIIDFKNTCSGEFCGNSISDCGTSKYNHVVMLWLGDGAHDSFVNQWTIRDNHFGKMVAPYSDRDDSREAHAILIYGNNNIIENNTIQEFVSANSERFRPGKDAEGIYIKGSFNKIINNSLLNCIGSSPDGAITIKLPANDNIIDSNSIFHDEGVGIQCYSDNSIISKNKVESRGNAEAAISVFVSTGMFIKNNDISAISITQKYKAAIEVLKSKSIEIQDNEFKGSPSLITISSCSGDIILSKNRAEIKGFSYGTNTYYNAPFVIQGGTYNSRIDDNQIVFINCRASQIVYCDPNHTGDVSFRNNKVSIDRGSVFSYVVRNRPKSFGNNIFEVEGNEVMTHFIDIKPLSEMNKVKKRVFGK